MKPRFVLVSFLGLAIIAELASLLCNIEGTTGPQWESEFCQVLEAYERGDCAEAWQIWTDRLQGTTRPQLESEFRQGIAAYDRGDRAKAEQIWRNSLKKSSTPHVPTVLWLGGLMKEEGQFGEAEALLKQGLDTQRLKFGANSLEAASAMHRLAELYEEEGKFGASIVLLKSVIRISSKSQEFGAVSSYMVTLNDLARIYVKQGQPDLARPLLVKSLKIHETELGKSNRYTKKVRRKLAAISAVGVRKKSLMR